MKFEKTNSKILGLRVITPAVHEDSRGYFFESFKTWVFYKNIPPHLIIDGKRYQLKKKFVQDNQSVSHKGVIRGMHLQLAPKEQAKLVRVIRGKILDVVVDLRPKSKTYLQQFSIELNDKDKKMLFIPPGCLHGFLSLEEGTIVEYKVTNYWDHKLERGVRWDDPDLNINWKLKEYNIDKPLVSEKDAALPSLKQYNNSK